MSDILDQIDAVVDAATGCPCGLPLPVFGPSLYWCTESCQIAWQQHEADPSRPSPAELREQQEQALADAGARAAGRAGVDSHGPLPTPPRRAAPGMQEQHREVGPVSDLYGSWQAAVGAIREQMAYTRWCPTCQAKTQPETITDPDGYSQPRASLLLDDRPVIQRCAACRTAWEGRPLTGVVQACTTPDNLVRALLSDGYRSAAYAIPAVQLQAWRDPAAIIPRIWDHLEAQLLDGVTDRDRQEQLAGHRAGRTPRVRAGRWDWLGGRRT